MWNFATSLLIGLASIPGWATFFARLGGSGWSVWWDYIKWLAVMGAGIGTAVALIPSQRASQAGQVTAAAIWGLIWLWHHTRTRRKRAAELLGAKSRALRDALVRKARETVRPRRVLRPVPGLS